jgi:hypothetical protein
MKKVILSVCGILLVSTVAVAQQNINEGHQLGYDNTGNISQVGTYNSSYLTQYGFSNTGTIQQTGSIIIVNDGPPAVPTTNLHAVQTQEGNNNTAFAKQFTVGNDSKQVQTGNGNDAFLRQNEGQPSVDVTLGDNESTQTQLGNLNVVATVQIQGSGNLSNQTQTGTSNHSKTLQVLIT